MLFPDFSKATIIQAIVYSLTSPTVSGACIEKILLSRQGVLNYAKLPSVTVVQGELVSGLTMLTSQTASMLQHHPAHLSLILQQYLKQQAPAGSTNGTPGESPPKAEETA